MNNYITHIPFHRLVDLAEGRLPPDERERLQAHLAACGRCSREAAEIERLISLMRADTSQDAPRPVISRAVDLFRKSSSSKPASPGVKQRITASLRFDSLGLAPAFGVRSGEPSARQLLYSAESHDIDLRIEPAEPAWILSGQVLGESAAGGLADLQGVERAIQTRLNEQSEFSFPPVPAGTYRLVIDLAGHDVEIDGLKIGI
jgi:anti-sigma factor RsiW